MFNHVVMRGNNRQDIFKDKADVAEFFRVLHYSYMKHPFTLSAYCIMTNHYHLLIRSPEAPLGKVMALINRRYSDYYKKKYNYSGYLYGSRYFAQKAESPTSILTISRSFTEIQSKPQFQWSIVWKNIHIVHMLSIIGAPRPHILSLN